MAAGGNQPLLFLFHVKHRKANIMYFDEDPDELVETLVVHELLHLHIKNPFDETEFGGTITEQTINILSALLVSQDKELRAEKK